MGGLLTVVLTLMACATTSSHISFYEVSSEDKDRAVIYVYRLPSMVGAAVPWSVRADNQIVANLKQKACVALTVSPGPHTITIAGTPVHLSVPGGEAAVDASSEHRDLKSPETGDFTRAKNDAYFIRIKGPNIALVARDEAMKEIVNMKYDVGLKNVDRANSVPIKVVTKQHTENSVDFSQLNLKISKTYIVEKISTTAGGNLTLTPKKGYQLVVIELRGAASKGTDITLSTKDFTAQSENEKFFASAVGSSKYWAVSGTRDDGVALTSKIALKEVDPLVFVIAFVLRDGINHFGLTCGKHYMGEAFF